MNLSIKHIGIFIIGILLLGSTAQAEEWIAYTRVTDGYWQLWKMTPDGKNQKQITFSKIDKRDPVWGKNGESLFYRTNNSRLYQVQLDGTGNKELLAKYHAINNPDYSLAIDSLTFVRFDPRAQDLSQIWKSKLGEEKAYLVTTYPGLKYQPVFSPNGQSVAFVQANKKDKTIHKLWMIAVEDGTSEQITRGEGLDTLPTFSPDGKFLAYTSTQDDARHEIYIVDIKTKKVKRLTNNEVLDSSPTYSPDGKNISFVSYLSGTKHIWVMDVNGKNIRQLTFGESAAMDPVWVSIEGDEN